jgi:hypothetical protein
MLTVLGREKLRISNVKARLCEEVDENPNAVTTLTGWCAGLGVVPVLTQARACHNLLPEWTFQ